MDAHQSGRHERPRHGRYLLGSRPLRPGQDNRWLDGAGDDLDRIQYGYDRAGNRIWRRNVVAAALGKEFDELYGYDAIHRLKHMARGTLNGGRTALTSETFAQCWTLDSTGNWQGFREDDTGNGSWDLIQQRSANAVNEISGISETAGPSWVTPAYSRAGNMTTLPQPADPTQSYTATYDAWNRLVKIADGADTVSEYAYDGAKRRIVQKSYSGGVLDETRHLYYTEPSSWQVLEERVGTSPDSADAQRQFVWGRRYIDDLVLRDRDTDGNGSLDERLYAMQDANWNVTAIVDNDGEVQGRYAYSAYGLPIFLTVAFNVQGSNTLSWEVLFAGYGWDFVVRYYHVRNRILHASLGIWMQRDPLRLLDGPYLLLYVHNDPLSRVDAAGLASWYCPRGDYDGTAPFDGMPCALEDREPNGIPPKPANGCTEVTSEVLIPGERPPGDWFPPIYTVVFRTACDKHDSCYQDCKSQKDACDRQFQNGLHDACDAVIPATDVLGRTRCYTIAELYYGGVVCLGADFYEDSQRDSCRCKKKC